MKTWDEMSLEEVRVELEQSRRRIPQLEEAVRDAIKMAQEHHLTEAEQHMSSLLAGESGK